MMIDFSQFGYAVGPTANLTYLYIAVHGFALQHHGQKKIRFRD